ncbi:hypothetical protein [Granulicoccus phenolivorans]|uniref:hypothetical protein n=1 Tax=Granulicoccus phenolivorans TaxID=266854 RepID=UPI000421792B|nr:hypothetical protein [Granulicoccus phenolivorans]
MTPPTDPRSNMNTYATERENEVAELAVRDFSTEEPDEISPAGSPTWYFRGQNFIVALTSLRAGDSLTRGSDQDEEFVILLNDSAPDVLVTAQEDGIATSEHVTERALIVVPPGASTVTAQSDTEVVRLFDVRTSDVVARASNSASYATPHPRVAPLVPWPDPVDGHRLRIYLVDRVAKNPQRFGRIYRTSAFMVNFMEPQEGPRDTENLSPHHHDDFEQGSLALAGDWIHHVRTSWTPRQSQWREDRHDRVGSPSLAVIPPPTIHTSVAIGPGRNQLIDIFSPPRVDFSQQPGWVLNAEDYPAPASTSEESNR